MAHELEWTRDVPRDCACWWWWDVATRRWHLGHWTRGCAWHRTMPGQKASQWRRTTAPLQSKGVTNAKS